MMVIEQDPECQMLQPEDLEVISGSELSEGAGSNDGRAGSRGARIAKTGVALGVVAMVALAGRHHLLSHAGPSTTQPTGLADATQKYYQGGWNGVPLPTAASPPSTYTAYRAQYNGTDIVQHVYDQQTVRDPYATTTTINYIDHEADEDYTEEEQLRKQNMNDGNKCGDEEEEFEGLCYTKCSILTENAAPFRSSGMICCETANCFLPWQMHMASPIPCTGYDVSGEDDGRDCPHSEGLCLPDEEQFLDFCYLSCKTLTNGEKPYRTAPLTCCKSSSVLECLDPFDDETNVRFDVGGGQGNDARPHLPETFETEH